MSLLRPSAIAPLTRLSGLLALLLAVTASPALGQGARTGQVVKVRVESSHGKAKVGLAAPPLTVGQWSVDGAPRSTAPLATPADSIRVVSFWSTAWGSSNRALPKLGEVARSYREDGVRVELVTSPSVGSSLENFDSVAKQHGAGLRVALGWDAEGKALESWLGSRARSLLPIAFVLDREGKVVFSGNPRWLTAPIEGLLAGTWDIERDMERLSRASRDFSEVYRASAQRPDRAVLLAAKFRTDHPTVADVVDELEFEALIELDRGAEAALVARRLLATGRSRKDSMLLNNTAWGLVDPARRLTQRDLVVAFEAASLAAELTDYSDGFVLDTLARVYAWKGDLDKAIEIQRKAVEHTDEEPIREALREYVERKRSR